MDPQVVAQVQRSFKAVLPVAAQVGELFYNRLFETHPEVRAMFPPDIRPQAEKLVRMLALIVSSLHRFDDIAPAIKQLAERHKMYGVVDAHYPIVGDTLLWSLSKALGNGFTPSIERAWRTAFLELSATMIAASE
jgi:hemoglobin-like flavoprotein